MNSMKTENDSSIATMHKELTITRAF